MIVINVIYVRQPTPYKCYHAYTIHTIYTIVHYTLQSVQFGQAQLSLWHMLQSL